MMKKILITLLMSVSIYSISLAAEANETNPAKMDMAQLNHAITISPLMRYNDSKAYINIYDVGNPDLELKAVTSSEPIAKEIQVHRHDIILHRTAPLKTTKLPNDGNTDVEKRGYHIIFIDLVKTLQKGDKLPIILVFGDGSYKTVDVTVE